MGMTVHGRPFSFALELRSRLSVFCPRLREAQLGSSLPKVCGVSDGERNHPSRRFNDTKADVKSGCDGLPSTCDDFRGGLYDSSRSTSWTDLGDATLNLELNLGRNESGAYGLDNVALGMSNATGGQLNCFASSPKELAVC